MAEGAQRIAPPPKRYTVRLGFEDQGEAEAWFLRAMQCGLVAGAAGLRHRELRDQLPAGVEVPMVVAVPVQGAPGCWVIEPPPAPS